MVEWALAHSLVTGVSFFSNSFRGVVNGLLNNQQTGWAILCLLVALALFLTRRRV